MFFVDNDTKQIRERLWNNDLKKVVHLDRINESMEHVGNLLYSISFYKC